MVLQIGGRMNPTTQIKGREGTMENIFVSRLGSQVLLSIYAVNGSMNILLTDDKVEELIKSLEDA